MDKKFKIEADWWGRAWTDQMAAYVDDGNAERLQEFELFVRTRLVELSEQEHFSWPEQVDWYEAARDAAAQSLQSLLTGQNPLRRGKVFPPDEISKLTKLLLDGEWRGRAS
ncbi:hypothetical protein J4G43_004955 [Bradyrhizobium barranii subsp. barranii]|uniref:Uncharacterized protein n=1 Tax=Bradyrhizobium barranii subsp. barranii TaxID=2823807 RepID=A0A939M0P0_9BRAD|nr:hypothetical protein [Bradyrhizobium barranii]UEM13672.1 hypothetical protein J4G43_004955 [Bradyrhizobium barranii subsp. barranii]